MWQRNDRSGRLRSVTTEKTRPPTTLNTGHKMDKLHLHAYCQPMKIVFKVLSLVVASGLLTSFFHPSKDKDPAYTAEIEHWQRERVASLKEEEGWLNLVGLFWLKEGSNTFGTDQQNDIVFPKGDPFIGTFERQQGKIRVQIKAGSKVTSAGKPVTDVEVIPDYKVEPPMFQLGSLRWFIIKRADEYAVRLRDLESPQLTHFKGIECFPIDKNWRVEAKLEMPDRPKMLTITNIVGGTYRLPLAGTLVFRLRGRTYRLEATHGDDQLFVVFGDETNGEETYGSGRFVYVNKPGADGKTILDFNKAYNPPCAFTPYATCPLPTRANRLSLRVEAGEKNYAENP